MGFDKLFVPLAGKPVLWHSIKAFHETKAIDEILIVTREEQMDEGLALVRGQTLSEQLLLPPTPVTEWQTAGCLDRVDRCTARCQDVPGRSHTDAAIG